MAQTWTFAKKAGAPAGAIQFVTALGSYTIDDASNTVLTVSTAQEAIELSTQPMLTLQGVSGTYVPPSAVNGPFAPSGFPGATATSRYVGATAAQWATPICLSLILAMSLGLCWPMRSRPGRLLV